jgi:CHAD domain-containing protein
MAYLFPYNDGGNSGGHVSGQVPEAAVAAVGGVPAEAAGARKEPAAETAGATMPDAPLDHFVRELLEERLKRANKEWRSCARKAGAEEVHDLRVSLRRFGENLWLFRRMFPKHERKQVRNELKAVMGLTGAVRDADIAIESFDKAGVEAGLACRIALHNARATAEAALAAALAVGLRTDVAGRWRSTLRLGEKSRGEGGEEAGNADARLSEAEGQQ